MILSCIFGAYGLSLIVKALCCFFHVASWREKELRRTRDAITAKIVKIGTELNPYSIASNVTYANNKLRRLRVKYNQRDRVCSVIGRYDMLYADECGEMIMFVFNPLAFKIPFTVSKVNEIEQLLVK